MTLEGLLLLFVPSQCCRGVGSSDITASALCHQVVRSALVSLLISCKLGMCLTFRRCSTVLSYLPTDLWFGKAIAGRGLPFWYCALHFAKQLHYL